jgi:hypothetical protein
VEMTTRSLTTCPNRGGRVEEQMPTDACLYFYERSSRGFLLRPKPGHCCVFCSFGNVQCPPIPLSQDCCRTQ